MKAYCIQQFKNIYGGHLKVPLSDFIFCKAVRMNKYAGRKPPAALIAERNRDRDGTFAHPPKGWRVSYLILEGTSTQQVYTMVGSPEEVLNRSSVNPRIPNPNYYLEKVIVPPLQRILRLVGCDVMHWLKTMHKPPRQTRRYQYSSLYSSASVKNNKNKNSNNKKNQSVQQKITSIFKALWCEICGQTVEPRIRDRDRDIDSDLYHENAHGFHSNHICSRCLNDTDITLTTLTTRLKLVQRKQAQLTVTCGQCSNVHQPALTGIAGTFIGPDSCASIECPVLFERARAVLKEEDITRAMLDLRLTHQ